jgi:TonB family protein
MTMKNNTARLFVSGLLILAVAAGFGCGKKAEAPAAGGTAAPAPAQPPAASSGLAATAFTLDMRILEGDREKTAAPPKSVTSSYLKFQAFVNFDNEEDVQAEKKIQEVYHLTELSLVATAGLAWEKGKSEKALYMFRLNGQEYLIMVTPGRLPERNHFHIEVYEQRGDKRANLLDSEFSLPDKQLAVFGFEDTQAKPYFITLRVARWVGESVADAGGPSAVGGVVGGVIPGTLPSGEKVKPPKLVKQVDPVYPEAARKAGVEGLVILEATTDTYGRMADVKVLQGIEGLNQAAIDAVKQWVYEPMVIDGKPRPVVFTVTVRFRLDDRKKPSVEGGVVGVVAGGVEGGVAGGVEGGVAGGVAGGVEGGVEEMKKFEGDAVRAVGKVQPPKLIRQVNPVYPEAARKAGVEGIVILEAKADEQGRVTDTRILRSIPALDQAAIDAVKQWVYEPMLINGQPRKVVFTVTVRFALKDGPKSGIPDNFAAGAVKAEGDIKPPMLIKEVQPVYPEIARVAGVEGVVILGVRTDELGHVVDAKILRSIPLLDQAAIDAVKQWVYEPYVKDGKPVPIVFTVTVRFVLK